MAAGGNVVSEKENKRLEFTVNMRLSPAWSGNAYKLVLLVNAVS